MLTIDAASVTVDEGQIAGNDGSVSDADGDEVTLTATVGLVVDNGDGNWTWSLTTSDGQADSQLVAIFGDDGRGGFAEVWFDLQVLNVAPSVGPVTVPPPACHSR